MHFDVEKVLEGKTEADLKKLIKYGQEKLANFEKLKAKIPSHDHADHTGHKHEGPMTAGMQAQVKKVHDEVAATMEHNKSCIKAHIQEVKEYLKTHDMK